MTFDTTEQANFRYIVGAIVLYFVLSFSKEILIEVANSKRYRAVIKNIEQYRSAFQIGEQFPEVDSSHSSIASRLMSFLVDYLVPYYIAAAGLAACYRLVPDRFWVF